MTMELLPRSQGRGRRNPGERDGAVAAEDRSLGGWRGRWGWLGLTLVGLLALGVWPQRAIAQLNRYCQITRAEAVRKETLRQGAFNGDTQAQTEYAALIRSHRAALEACRREQWPRNQAVWVRLYPCDLQPGILDAVMDRIVNLGYNQVYLEAFYNGQVLLPQGDNPTAWPSVVQNRGVEQRDLLAEAMAKAQQRGLEPHTWVFSLNFGSSYGNRRDRQGTLAVNGRGDTSLAFARSGAISNEAEIFVDPYHFQAQQDYQRMLRAITQRRPRSVLFDYIRYPRGNGTFSVASRVQDLWIYGDAARQAFLQRDMNQKGRVLMERFLSRGSLTEGDVLEVDQRFPLEGDALWQTRVPEADWQMVPAATRRSQLETELWRLSVAHAIQGVVDFLTRMGTVAQQDGVAAGAVFFPNGNQMVGSGGFDSRLQHWDRFPTWISWHPMAYGVCGHSGCIVDEVRRVMTVAGARGGEFVRPAIAGVWGQATPQRPSLEAQMAALQRAFPQLTSVSHFAYSWQDPQFDRNRSMCRL